MKITLSHGSGGKATSDLINSVFAASFSNPVLNQMDDCAIVDGCGKIAVTTDSFVVTPLIFPGGDIGRLAVCGTVNDLLMRGSVPKYITSAFIIEEGADTDSLKTIARSMAETAAESGVSIIAGDTKVIEGNGGIYINTAGVGFVPKGIDISCKGIQSGDSVIVSGNMGDHHSAILSARMSVENDIKSDCAPLNEMVKALIDAGVEIHTMRDITRGGLGTVLNELSEQSGCSISIREQRIPISAQVSSFCKILGLNPMYMGNEGKLVLFVPASDEQKAVDIMKQCRYGENSAAIGTVAAGEGVTLITKLGGKKTISVMHGEGLPRIC